MCPDDKQEEERRRGRPGPHLIIFVYTIESSTQAYIMAGEYQTLRGYRHCHYYCKLFVDGYGSQASKGRQNCTLRKTGRTIFFELPPFILKPANFFGSIS